MVGREKVPHHQHPLDRSTRGTSYIIPLRKAPSLCDSLWNLLDISVVSKFWEQLLRLPSRLSAEEERSYVKRLLQLALSTRIQSYVANFEPIFAYEIVQSS